MESGAKYLNIPPSGARSFKSIFQKEIYLDIVKNGRFTLYKLEPVNQ